MKISTINCPMFVVDGEGTSESMVCQGYDSLNVEVSGYDACLIHFEGCIDCVKEVDGKTVNKEDSEIEWHGLTTVNLKTFEVAESVISKGLFIVPVSGCLKVRAVVDSVTGDGSIVCTLK